MTAVVLDLSDQPVEGDISCRDEARLLVDMLRETAENFFTPEAAAFANRVADQIEAQIPKPKPVEPTGLGAVVEDADGERWVRFHTFADGDHWAGGDSNRNNRRYDEIAAVRVLSEGVTA